MIFQKDGCLLKLTKAHMLFAFGGSAYHIYRQIKHPQCIP